MALALARALAHRPLAAHRALRLTGVLRLTGAERDHLYRVVGFVPPSDREFSDDIPPGLGRLLTRLGDTAAAVFAADYG
ncbi:hypothetical protein [Actinomadura sp. NPDC000600]|uniref:hypothetical protein n=1 Tax=Actinomadura sp. NPDC000600 TaxID=3154262 RepID=UPI00339661B2